MEKVMFFKFNKIVFKFIITISLVTLFSCSDSNSNNYALPLLLKNSVQNHQNQDINPPSDKNQSDNDQPEYTEKLLNLKNISAVQNNDDSNTVTVSWTVEIKTKQKQDDTYDISVLNKGKKFYTDNYSFLADYYVYYNEENNFSTAIKYNKSTLLSIGNFTSDDILECSGKLDIRLTKSGTYYFWVQAIYDRFNNEHLVDKKPILIYNNSSSNANLSFVYHQEQAPFNVKATYIDPENIAVTWQDSKYSNKYYVYYNTEPTTAGAVKHPEAAKISDVYNYYTNESCKTGSLIIPVAENKIHYFWITAANNYDEESNFSNQATSDIYSATITVQEAVTKIKSLPSGTYDIKITGSITHEDIASLKNAMKTDSSRYINLDLSQTIGLTELQPDEFMNEYSLNANGPLSALVLPISVTKIDKSALDNCKKLTTLTAPGVTILGSMALYRCESLTEITLADTMESIGDYAFQYCSSLEEIKLNAKEIKQAFSSNGKLQKVIIGKDVEKLKNEFLGMQSNLSSIEVDSSNTNFKIIDEMLYSYDGTRLLKCPVSIAQENLILPETVTSVDSAAFAYCKNIKSITLTNIENISSALFCSSEIINVSIPKAKIIEYMAFYDCKKLESIYIPDTVTEIGSSAFSKTSALKSIFIPASVKTIDHFAFEYWENDQTINCEHSEIIIKTSFFGPGWDEEWSNYDYKTPAKAVINLNATRN